MARTLEHVQMSYLVDAHAEYLRASGHSERTIGDRVAVLRRLHDHLPYGLAYAATEQLDAWLATVGWSRWTRHTYAGHIRGFYRWATKGAHLDGDPSIEMARPVPPRCVPNPVTDDELERALRSREPWFTGVVLAAYAGLRDSEIAACRREHITEAYIRVPMGKGGQPGSVPTHPFVWSVLSDRPAGHVFVDHLGQPVTGRWIPPRARHHFDRVGLPGVHMHRFRHWFGTHVQALFGDARVTQECLRHASPVSTAGYTLVAGHRKSAAVASLPVPGAPASL
jgi:integrase/recombinase XerC